MEPADRTELARRIHLAAHLTGTFTLRSGAVSHEYFDKYRFESDPSLLHAIAEATAPLVPPGTDARRPHAPLRHHASGWHSTIRAAARGSSPERVPAQSSVYATPPLRSDILT